MAQIFISYARKDLEYVKELHKKLKDAGYKPWMDKVDLVAGRQWKPAIKEAISHSDFFLLCLSNNSVKRRGFLQVEIKTALDLWREKLEDDIYLIPVMIEPVNYQEIPTEVSEFHGVELHEDDGWEQLTRALEYGLKQRETANNLSSTPEGDRKEESITTEDSRARNPEPLPPPQQSPPALSPLYNFTTVTPEAPVRVTERQQGQALLEGSAKIEGTEEQPQPSSPSSKLETESLLKEQSQFPFPPEASTGRSNLESQKAAESIIIFTSALRRLLILVTSLFITVLSFTWFALNHNAKIPPKPTPSPPIPTLVSFEFKTVTLSSQDIEDPSRKLRALYFTEDLDGVPLDMVKIPGGDYMMGSPENEAQRDTDEEPPHSVKVSEFFMGRFEITRKQWRQVARMPKVEIDLQEDPSHFKDSPRQPVEQVSWKEAVEFCKRLEKKTGRAYRLPTEAEWEYAARARTTTPFAFGSTITTQIVNYNGNYPYGLPPEGIYRGKTVEVGSLGLANAFGLSDMHGNVWEWCEDKWRGNYKDAEGAPRDGKAWITNGSQDNQDKHVIRGGSWDSYRRNCRSALRYGYESGNRSLNTGFRVACTP